MADTYLSLAENALAGVPPSAEQAHWIVEGADVSLLPLLDAAFKVREKHFGREVMVHVLNNVQNGLCPEDCGYCSQNKDSEAPIRKYAMKSDEEIFAEAENAAKAGASRYCMVLSGRGPTIERTKKFAALIVELKRRHPVEQREVQLECSQQQPFLLRDFPIFRIHYNDLAISDAGRRSSCNCRRSWVLPRHAV